MHNRRSLSFTARVRRRSKMNSLWKSMQPHQTEGFYRLVGRWGREGGRGTGESGSRLKRRGRFVRREGEIDGRSDGNPPPWAPWWSSCSCSLLRFYFRLLKSCWLTFSSSSRCFHLSSVPSDVDAPSPLPLLCFFIYLYYSQYYFNNVVHLYIQSVVKAQMRCSMNLSALSSLFISSLSYLTLWPFCFVCFWYWTHESMLRSDITQFIY